MPLTAITLLYMSRTRLGHSGRVFIMNLDDILSEIHTHSLTELTALRISRPSQRRLTNEFFDALSEKGQCLAIKKIGDHE